jgi:hypothetical protein
LKSQQVNLQGVDSSMLQKTATSFYDAFAIPQSTVPANPLPTIA